MLFIGPRIRYNRGWSERDAAWLRHARSILDGTCLRSSKLGAYLLCSGHERLELCECEVAREPREPAVRIDPQPLRRHALEHLPDSPSHQIGALDVEVLEVEDARAQLFRAIELTPQLGLGHLAIRELEHELVGARARDRREERPIRSLAEAEPFQGPEADVPEPPLDDDAVEAPVVELDQPLRFHDEALIDVVDLEIAGAAG